MRLKAALLFVVFVAGLAAASTASADVQITMRDGRVSVIAKDATLRQILAEWARVGQTKILNADRVPSPPLTLQLNNVPETQALDTLLRTVSGYVASPRAEIVPNLSRFDRIAIIPTPAPPMSATSGSAVPPVFPQPQAFQPFPRPVAPVGDDQQDVPNQAPVFNQFPPPQVVNPAQQGDRININGAPAQVPGVMPAPGPLVLPQGGTPAAAPGAYPGASAMPVGSAVPGMIAVPPGQPAQPKKPGGGQ
jgi:hypothetical protein